MSLKRRNTLFWEPIYDTDLNVDFATGSWNFENQKGPRHFCFSPTKDQTKPEVVKGVTFQECDFRGDFNYRVIFIDCNFDKCDFAGSKFDRGKFTDCKFSKTTFSLCNLFDCELRGCSFYKIGFSGNETLLEKTLITNPSDFISGGEANVSNLPAGKSPTVQKLRFEITKSTLARSLMVTLSNEGSEKTYYDGVKISTIQDCKAKSAENVLGLINVFKIEEFGFSKKIWSACRCILGITGGLIDLFVLVIFGLVNSWGSSVSRPTAIGLCLVAIFGLFYSIVESTYFLVGAEKATEIFLLFGYTKHSTLQTATDMQVAQICNALLGVFWYVVTIPTIVNKLTRVRG